jgi:hypothetical protein
MRVTFFAICLTAWLFGACSFSFNVGTAPGEISGDPEFSDVVLATELDPTSKKPVAVVTEFPTDVTGMFAALNAKNVPAGSEFRFRWLKANEQVLSLKVDVPISLSDNWVYGSLEPTGDVPAGEDYAVEVLFNDELVSTATFRVVDR